MKTGPRRVLVLDPNPEAQEKVRELLDREDVTLYFATGLADAVHALKEVRFHCAIVDTDLGEIPGHQAVPILKAIDAALPVIVTAERNTREQEIKVCEQDIFFYYIKSFGPQELKLAVREALRVSTGSEDRGTDRRTT